MAIIKKTFILSLFLSVFLLSANAQSMEDENVIKDPGPGSYKIINNKNLPIKIPFKIHNGKPLMELEINGKKATLMIDNGVLWDQIWLFGSPLVTELELKPLDDATIGGSGEGDPTRAYISENLSLKFEDIIFYEQPVLVSPPAAGFSKMFPGADGQLCNTFFKHFIVEFDFIKNEVILHDPKQFKYKGNGSILEMKASDAGTHSVPFSFQMLSGKSYSDEVDLDFGGIYAFKIALNNSHNISLPDVVEETHSFGAQGKSSEYKGKIKRMTIGKYNFDMPDVIFGDEKTSRIHPNNLGVIGLPLFMKFRIIFDYFNYKLILEPNENFNGRYE